MRHEEYDGEERECSSDHTAAYSEHALVKGRTGTFQRNERAGDECGVDPGPVNRRIKDVTEHPCEGDFEREVHVCGIGERVRHK